MKKIIFFTLFALAACGKNENVCKKSDADLAKEGYVVVNIGESQNRWQDLSGEGYLQVRGLSGMQKIRSRTYEPANGSVKERADRLLSKHGEKATFILEGTASGSDKFIYNDVFGCRDR